MDMTVYYEILFLSDFCVDALLSSLTVVALRSNLRVGRIFLVSFFGGLGAVLTALFPNYRIFIFVTLLPTIPFFMKRQKNYREYFLSLLAFMCVTAVLGGVVLMAKALWVPTKTLRYGAVPISVGLGGSFVVFMAQKLLAEAPKERKKNALSYPVSLSCGGKRKTYEGFYDSGNRVYSDEGEQVIFVAPEVYHSLLGHEETLAVRTAGGVFTTTVAPAELTVRYPSGNVAVYRVKAAKSDALLHESIILHGDMTDYE